MNSLLHLYPGDRAVELVGRVSFEIALVIGLAAVFAHVVLRLRPAARHALWLGVLICVVLSPVMLAAVERAGWMWSVGRPAVLEKSPPDVPKPAPVLVGKARDSAVQTRDQSQGGGGPDLADVDVTKTRVQVPLGAMPAQRAAADTWRFLVSIGTVVWLTGIVFLLARLWHGNRQVRCLLSAAQPLDARRLYDSLKTAARVLGVKALPPIVTSPGVTCPVVAGLVRPTVVLPIEVVRSEKASQLADVLIHECAHALRRDTWIGLAQRLVQLIFWPHPLIYLMNRSLSRAREEVCDNYVLRRGDAAGYAQTLLELAEHYGGRPTPAPTLAMFSPRWKLEDRVAGLLDPYRRQATQVSRMKFLAVAALLVIGGSGIAAGRFKEPEPKRAAAAKEPPKPAEPARQALAALMADDNVLRKLNNPTNVEFLDLALNDALQYLGEYHAVTVHRDAEPIQAAKTDLDYPITAKLSGVPLRTVLRLLLEPLRLDFFVDKGELVVTTREVAAGQFSDFRYSIARQLDDVVRAGISPADLGEAIVRTIDPSTWEPAGGQGSLQPEPAWLQIRQRMNVRLHLDDLLRELHDALRDRRVVADEDRHEIKEYPIAHLQELKIKDAAILERLNETILAGQAAANRGRSSATIKGDRLILTQPRWVLAEADSLFGFLTNLYNGAATRDSVRGTFEGNVLLSVEARRRIIRNRLTQTIPVDFVDLPLVDGLIYVNEAGSPINYFVSEETKKAGIKWSSLVNMKADNNSLSTLLDKLLVPFKLDWYIADPDVVVVTTRADAAGRMEPRVYRTKELLAGGQTEKGLMARIAAIEPDSWATLAGPGQMRLLPGVLIVSHNRRTHEQISRLLASLNPGK